MITKTQIAKLEERLKPVIVPKIDIAIIHCAEDRVTLNYENGEQKEINNEEFAKMGLTFDNVEVCIVDDIE